MRILLSILFAFTVTAAEIPLVMVPTISSLTNLTPSPVRAAVAVIPATGQWSLWRFSGSSEADVDNVSVLPTSIGVGRWLNAPDEWLSSNGGYGTNLYLQGSTFISELSSDKVTLSYDGLTNPDADASPIGFVKMMAPLVLGNITNFLGTASTTTGRSGYVLTNYLANYGYSSQWIWCPDITTPDNGLNIRRPVDKPTDADAGRWQAIPIEGLVTVPNMASLLLITPPTDRTLAVQTLGYYGPGLGGDSLYVNTNSITGTNAYAGKVVALGGAQSWELAISQRINVRSFGVVADGSTDNTLRLQACVDYAEASGSTTVWFEPGLLPYKWSTVTNRFCEFLGGYGAGYNGSLIEQTAGTTNNFIVLNPPAAGASARFYAPTAGPQPAVRNFTLIGHSEGNLVAPKAITTVTDRLSFSVATGNLPYTGGAVLTNTYPYLGHVFFYSSLNKYCGYGVITNINYGTGLITLMTGSDNYATPTNSGGILTNTMKVCFSQVVTESSAFSTETFIDGATAGTSGIYVTSTDAASVSSKILLENLNIYGFHCGLRLGSVLLPKLSKIETKFCAYAGYADANPGNVRDGSLNDVFVFGKYQPNFNSNEGGTTETVTYDNPGFRAPAYGFYGGIASGEMITCAVNFCVNGAYFKNLAATRILSLLLEGIPGPALWLDGSKFGSANFTATFTDLDIRTLSTNDVPYPTLTSWTNRPAIYYKNSGVGAPSYTFTTANIQRLASTHQLFDVGIQLVNSDGQFSFMSIGSTNGISGNMLGFGSAVPAMMGRFGVNGTSGYGVQANTFQVLGVTYLQNSGAGNLLRMTRPDVAGIEADFNLGSSIGNWTGTSLVGWSMESSGGLYLKDTDASRSTFIRSLANGSSTLYSSIVEPLYDGSNNLLQWGGGSAGAYAATLQDFVIGATTTTTTGTKVVRISSNGVRIDAAGIAGSTSADAPLRVDSTTGGILFPRMTGTQRDAIGAPTDGLVIYNSTTSKLQVRAGAAWVDLH
jgi:hypothetical protein